MKGLNERRIDPTIRVEDQRGRSHVRKQLESMYDILVPPQSPLRQEGFAELLSQLVYAVQNGERKPKIPAPMVDWDGRSYPTLQDYIQRSPTSR